jgi:hypothetical protein
MGGLFQRIKDEPVAFGEFIRTSLLLAIAFGVTITEQQLAAVMIFIGAGITFFTRAAVTPNSKVDTVVTVERTGTPPTA